MRDAQIEAIKVYLFLKIACECNSLAQLFCQGFFNSIDLNEIELSKSTREYLFQNPAAAALFEYARLTNDRSEQVSERKIQRELIIMNSFGMHFMVFPIQTIYLALPS